MQTYDNVLGRFENYYLPYIHELELQFNNYNRLDELFSSEEDIEIIKNSFINGCLKRLSEFATYSLIDAYQQQRKEQKNVSYHIFNQYLRSKEGVEFFHRCYPYVKDMCESVVEQVVQKLYKIFDTILQHQNALLQFVGQSKDGHLAITTMDIFQGDLHDESFVAIFTIAGKKVVLKQRPNIGERILNVFQKHFAKKGVALPVVRNIILTENLIVQDFVKFEKGLTKQEVTDFYQKFGLMAAIFIIIGSKDLHCENIIATHQGPFFIDLEVAFTAKQRGNSYALIQETALFNSMEQKMVYGDQDLSAFSGGQKSDTVTGYQLINLGQDDIDLVSKEYLTPTTENIPYDCQGDLVDPWSFKSEVVEGFEQGLSVFKDLKKDILAELELLEHYEHRIVLRNTGFYSQYLQNLSLPIYMQNSEKRENLLELLRSKSSQAKHIIDSEVEALQRGVVPYFTINKILKDGDKQFKEEFLDRLNHIDESTLERERHYLQLYLNIDGTGEISIPQDLTSRIDAEIKNFERLNLVDQVFKYGTVDNSVSPRILNYSNDLYIFGASLLLLQEIKPDSKLFAVLKQTVIQQPTRRFISGLTGYQAGRVLATQFGVDLNDPNPDDLKFALLELTDIDFSNYGSAILALHYLYKIKNQINFKNQIMELGKSYLEASYLRQEVGLLHGFSGDLIVLTFLKDYLNVKDIEDKILLALQRENSMYHKGVRKKVTTDNVNNDKKQASGSLAYGASGILISRLVLGLVPVFSPKLRAQVLHDIEQTIQVLLNHHRYDFIDDTLINGYSGAVLSLKLALESNLLEDNIQLKQEISDYLAGAKEELIKTSWRCQGFENLYIPAFFNGRMGITFLLCYIHGWLPRLDLSAWLS